MTDLSAEGNSGPTKSLETFVPIRKGERVVAVDGGPRGGKLRYGGGALGVSISPF